MKQTIDAIFEDGAFKPVDPIDLAVSEGQRVRLTVETPELSQAVLELATHVYEGLSDAEIDAIEEIALDRSLFFKNRTLD